MQPDPWAISNERERERILECTTGFPHHCHYMVTLSLEKGPGWAPHRHLVWREQSLSRLPHQGQHHVLWGVGGRMLILKFSESFLSWSVPCELALHDLCARYQLFIIRWQISLDYIYKSKQSHFLQKWKIRVREVDKPIWGWQEKRTCRSEERRRASRPPWSRQGAQANWGDSLEQPTRRPGLSIPFRWHFSGERWLFQDR